MITLTWGIFCHPKAKVHMANQFRKFEAPRFSCSRDILGEQKIKQDLQ